PADLQVGAGPAAPGGNRGRRRPEDRDRRRSGEGGHERSRHGFLSSRRMRATAPLSRAFGPGHNGTLVPGPPEATTRKNRAAGASRRLDARAAQALNRGFVGGVRISRRELLATGAAAAAAMALPARSTARSVHTFEFAAMPDGERWPGWSCGGVANLRVQGAHGLLEAG